MTILYWSNWENVPVSEWRWPHFPPREMACRGSGAVKVDTELMDRLEALRAKLGVPLWVTSGYRVEWYNAQVGGAKNSQHLYGKAADIAVMNVNPNDLIREAEKLGFGGIGTYSEQGFVHVDVGPKRRWAEGPPFPPSATKQGAEGHRTTTEPHRRGDVSGALMAGAAVTAGASLDGWRGEHLLYLGLPALLIVVGLVAYHALRPRRD